MTSSETGNGIFNQELKLRVISALVLGISVLLITWIGGYTFALLSAVIAFAVFFEYTRICVSVIPARLSNAGFAALVIIVGTWLAGGHLIAYLMTLCFGAVFLIWEMLLRRSAWMSTGIFYATIPFFAMTALRGDTDLGLFIIFVLFACVWGADVFAFFFGKALGGPKLAPRLSPKKTWSGFIGSLIGAILMSLLIAKLFGHQATTAFFLLILFLAVISQIGDLMESMLKRTFNVKDSGSLIPGHGGVLDRVDGLIVAGAALWIVLGFIRMQESVPITIEALFKIAFLSP